MMRDEWNSRLKEIVVGVEGFLYILFCSSQPPPPNLKHLDGTCSCSHQLAI